MARPPLSSDDQARELASTLVDMARADCPSRAAYHRVLRAMARAGVAGGFLAGTSAGAGIAVSSKSGLSAIPLSIVKWTAVGAIGGALAVGAPKMVDHVPLLSAHRVLSRPDAPRERPAPKSPVVAAPPRAIDPAPVTGSSVTTVEPRVAEPAPPRPPRAKGDVLLMEVAELDQARSLLLSHAPDRAVGALDTYFERHPDGRLRLEATVLRIEALAKSGKRAAAAALAQQFLAAHSQTPLAHRVREIEASLGAPTRP
jgi:hypothetical protein